MWPQTRPGDVRFSVPVGEAPESPRRVDAIVGQPLPSLRPRSSGGARPQGRQPAWWTRRSTMATTATGSPKISAQALKVLFELTMSDRRSCRELTRARKSAAVSGSSANPLVAEGSTPERRRRTAHGDGGARATGRDVAGEARAGGSGPELPGDRAGRIGRRPDPTAHRSARSRKLMPASVAARGVSFDGTNTAVRTGTFGYRCPRACGPDRVGGKIRSGGSRLRTYLRGRP